MSNRSYIRYCSICGLKFEAKRSDARYCKKSTCRGQAHMDKKRQISEKTDRGSKGKMSAKQSQSATKSAKTDNSLALVTCLCGCGEQFLTSVRRPKMYKLPSHKTRAWRNRVKAGISASQQFPVLDQQAAR